MAADNLLLVHGRIGTLDIYAVAAMIWAAALYLRGRPVLAGVVIGVGACVKEVAPYVLLVLLRARAAAVASPRPAPAMAARGPAPGDRAWSRPRRRRSSALLGAASTRSRRRTTRRRASWSPAARSAHIAPHAHLRRAADQPARAAGDRLLPVGSGWSTSSRSLYLRINPSLPARAVPRSTRRSHFLGMISPPILLRRAALRLVVRGVARGPRRRLRTITTRLELARRSRWFLGTFVPFVLLSLIDSAPATSTTW